MSRYDDEEYGYGDEYHEDDYGYAEQGGVEQSTWNGSTGTKSGAVADDKNVDWEAEAELPYKSVVLKGKIRFMPSQLIEKNGSEDPKKWTLKNDGKIILSLTNGRLTFESGDKNDFTEVLRVLEERRKDMECPMDKKNKKKRQGLTRTFTDLIKSGRIFNVTSSWKGDVVFEINSVPASKHELTPSTSGCVAKTLLAGTYSAHTISDHEIFNRPINNLSVAFRKKFPGITSANVERTYVKVGDNHCLVPANGPLAFFHNRDLPDNEKITTILKAGNLEQIELTWKQTEAAIATVKEKIGKNISLGDATGDTKVSIFVAPDIDRLKEDLAFKADKKTGTPFLSFADAFEALPNGTKEDHKKFMETYHHFSFMLELTYCPEIPI